MPTARNARGIDIVAYAEDGRRMLGLQVKSLSRKSPVPLGSTLEKVAGDYWLIVVGLLGGSPTTYILTPDEVRKGAFRGVKNGLTSFWLQPKTYDRAAFTERWDRLDSGSARALPS